MKINRFIIKVGKKGGRMKTLSTFVIFMIVALNVFAVCKEPKKISLKPGMKVIVALAGPNWSEAKIDSMSGGNITVKYYDGGLGNVGRREVVAHPDILYHGRTYPCFKRGDRVIAKSHGKIWRTAVITMEDGDKFEIQFDDKTRKKLKGNEIVRIP